MTAPIQPPEVITAILKQIQTGQLANELATVYPDILQVILKSGLDSTTKNNMTTALTKVNNLMLTLNQGVVGTAITSLIALISSIGPKTTAPAPVTAPAPTPPIDTYAPAK